MNCPVTGKPCLKHKAYTVTERKGDDERSFSVCEDCMHLKGSAPSSGEHDPCPTCGSTLDEIVASSQVGCSACYEHFAEPMTFVVAAVQGGADRHKGDPPDSFKRASAAAVNPVAFASQVLAEMRAAAGEERYEQAAALEGVLSRVKGIIMRSDEKGDLAPEDAELLARIVYAHMFPGSAEGV